MCPTEAGRCYGVSVSERESQALFLHGVPDGERHLVSEPVPTMLHKCGLLWFLNDAPKDLAPPKLLSGLPFEQSGLGGPTRR